MIRNQHLTLIILLLITAGKVYAIADTLQFDIILFGDKIGTMTVTREIKPDGFAYYRLYTKSRAKLLWIKKETISENTLTYKGGKLLNSSYKEIENGILKRWNDVTFNGTVYQVNGHNGKKTFTEVPTNSGITMYFTPPQKQERLFYEAEADFTNVEHPDANTCLFKSSDGHTNIYHYSNGKISDMEFRISIANVKMVRTR
jgi:hypothetical protein